MDGSAEDQRVAPHDHYEREWMAFALRRTVALTLLAGWLPFCAALFYLSRHYIHEPEWSIVAMVAWILAAFAAVWWAGEFRCPRCRRRYGALGHEQTVNLTRGLFDKVCANCKLTKFEQRDRGAA